MSLKIAIVGSGRLAATLGLALKRAGYPVTEIVCRARPASLRRARKLARNLQATVVTNENLRITADIIWFCVPDGKINQAAKEIRESANWKNRLAFHSSGALASDELGPLRKSGAALASVHPLMTFVEGSRPKLKGVPFALEGDHAAIKAARELVRRLGGEPFTIRKHEKVLYHAWGTFASPLLISLLATTEQVARASGIEIRNTRKKMLPILKQTLANYAALGPAQAFSGPIVRGDAEILRQHLRSLRKIPQAGDVYVTLALAALRYLPAGNRKKLQAALGRKARS